VKPDYEKNGVTLYCADCRDVLPTLGKVDAVVTDPPYGIRADEAAAAAALQRIAAEGKTKAGRGWKYYGESKWDQDRPCLEIFNLMREKSKYQIIWGGNYFTDFLPPSMQWLIWDKGQRNFSLADFEVAWGSQNKAGRIFNFSRGAALLDGKEHPTQKPIEVIRWCLSQLPESAETILDPFMGSGTTGVASVRLGRKFIGIEIEPKYFEIAVRRIEAAFDETSLLDYAQTQEQLDLAGGIAGERGGR